MILTIVTALLVVLFGWLPEWAFVISATIEGILFTPAIGFIVVPSSRLLRGLFGRLHFMYGQIIAGRSAFVQKWNGMEIAPVRNGVIKLEDKDLPIDVDETTWYRLGNRPTAFTWDPTTKLAEKYTALESCDLLEEGDDIGVLSATRGGFHRYTPKPELAKADDDLPRFDYADVIADGGEEPHPKLQQVAGPDRLLLRFSRLAMRLRGAGDLDNAEQAEQKSRQDHGGKQNLSNKWMGILAAACLLGGAFTGVIYLGWVVA